jgi:hypothetical protein
MSDYKPTQPEAYTAMLNALVDGTFAMLFSDDMTDEEVDILNENLTEIMAIILEAFGATFQSSEEWSDANKAFTMKMTIPNRPMLDILKEQYYEFADQDSE